MWQHGTDSYQRCEYLICTFFSDESAQFLPVRRQKQGNLKVGKHCIHAPLLLSQTPSFFCLAKLSGELILCCCRAICRGVQMTQRLHCPTSKPFRCLAWAWPAKAVHDCNSAAVCVYCRQPLLQQQQQQQLMLSAPQDNYLASRNQALHEVESAIRDIGGIFQQLAHMVSNMGKTLETLHVSVQLLKACCLSMPCCT